MNREQARKWFQSHMTSDPMVNEAYDIAIEALSEPINCVKCKHYYETEDDTDVHGHCRMDTAHTNLISRGEWVISIICLGALAVAVIGLLAKIKFLFL